VMLEHPAPRNWPCGGRCGEGRTGRSPGIYGPGRPNGASDEAGEAGRAPRSAPGSSSAQGAMGGGIVRKTCCSVRGRGGARPRILKELD
jgi:hypothetical protein